MCREEAHKLWQRQPELASQGVGMVCVVKEELKGQIEELAQAWPGPVYLDEQMDFFKYVHGGKVARRGTIALLGSMSRINRSMSYIKTTGVGQNMTGDGWNLGGLLVMRPGDHGVEYCFKEENFGVHAPLEEVAKAAMSATASQYTGTGAPGAPAPGAPSAASPMP